MIKKINRKLTKLVNTFIGIILSICSYAVIKFFAPFFTIRIGEIESRAIGHLCSFEVYLCEKKLIYKNEKKNIDLFYKNNKICNKLIFQKLSKDLNMIPAIFVEQLFILLQEYNSNSKHLVPYRHWRANKFWQRADKYEVTGKLPSQFQLSEEENKQGEEFLREIGIMPSDKYVCIFSRSSEYYGDESPRNSSINCYTKSISWLIDQGYKVVRVGDSATEKLRIKNPNLFDYSIDCNNKTELKGIFLILRCQYMISCCTGYDHIATMLRKKLLYVNYTETHTLELLNSEQLPLYIPKKLVWAESGMPLLGSDILRLGVHTFYKEEQYENIGVNYLENSEQEILDAVIEMTATVSGTFIESSDEKIFRKKYIEKFRCNFIKDLDMIPKIGIKFLKENEYLLD